MLVLSRQKDQAICIGDNIEIYVVDIIGKKVRLGITAPSKIPVHRKEVYEMMKKEEEDSSKIYDNLKKELDPKKYENRS